MLATAATIATVRAPGRRRNGTVRTLATLDRRTRASKRAGALVKAFEAEIGGTISASQRFALERAAALVALAEDAKARRLGGEQGITLEDVVRIDNAAARAVKALGIKAGGGRKPQSLAEYLASRATVPVAAPTPPDVPSPPLAPKSPGEAA